MGNNILLNDLLQINDLSNCKIRLVKSHKQTNPLKFMGGEDREMLDNWLLWNYSNKSFKVDDVVIGLIRIGDGKDDRWVLFDVAKIIEDLGVKKGVGYKKKTLDIYKKFLGRVVVSYKNKSQNLIRLAESLIEECVVSQIMDREFEDNKFPGYDNVDVNWSDLKRCISTDSWKTALQNQKGVYLITDTKSGKMYVGSAYGENMIYGRWMSYVKNGHGGNVDLKKLSFEDIKLNFKYSILEIYKYSVDDQVIIDRESWWKRVLMSREYGYNKN